MCVILFICAIYDQFVLVALFFLWDIKCCQTNIQSFTAQPKIIYKIWPLMCSWLDRAPNTFWPCRTASTWSTQSTTWLAKARSPTRTMLKMPLKPRYTVYFMVFIIDGCSFYHAHTWSKSGFSICSRHLVTSKESLNSIFFSKKDLVYIIRAQREMSNHLI